MSESIRFHHRLAGRQGGVTLSLKRGYPLVDATARHSGGQFENAARESCVCYWFAAGFCDAGIAGVRENVGSMSCRLPSGTHIHLRSIWTGNKNGSLFSEYYVRLHLELSPCVAPRCTWYRTTQWHDNCIDAVNGA